MKLRFNSEVLPLGFEAAGVCAKIKKSGKKDLALFYSQVPCVTSAMFTSSQIKAAPIEVSMEHLRAGFISALIVNSGNANCMTGALGVRDAKATAEFVAEALFLKKEEVLVSSTGIIGKPLPMQKLKTAVPHLVKQLSSQGLGDAACAILTTDTFSKVVSKTFKIGKVSVTMTGISKGAGMIAPAMKSATMLSFIFTDCRIQKAALDKALYEAVEPSFNAITIDNCMSTNDTVIVMANGCAGNKIVKTNSKEEKIFKGFLSAVCLELAKMIVRDAEGATKFIEINVRGARNGAEAKKLAFSVANSNLFKCAMFGSDPNWGRIAAALWSIQSSLDWQKLDIYLNKRVVFKNGKPVVLKDTKFLGGRDIIVGIDLKKGHAQQTVFTSDLSYEYVKINADYN